jgi:hypothetical protein
MTSPSKASEVASVSQSFVAAGAPAPPANKKKPFTGLLHKANDWKLLVDYLHDQYVFPPEIYQTTQRPDIVIWSPSLKIVIFIELTCPMEENMEAWMH